QVWRESHEDVIETETKIGEQNDVPAAKAVGHGSEQRGENELHERPNGCKNTVHSNCFCGVAAEKGSDELEQEGTEHSHGEHVEHESDEDEGERGTTKWCRSRRGG